MAGKQCLVGVWMGASSSQAADYSIEQPALSDLPFAPDTWGLGSSRPDSGVQGWQFESHKAGR